MIHIGIDPGVKTGYAEWDSENKLFHLIKTFSIVEAMHSVRENQLRLAIYGRKIKVHFEDTTLRKWKGHAGRERLKGVGSVERDCKIWREFCEFHNIEFEAVPPQRMKGYTKLSAEQFKRITGYEGRTSNHSRDSAMLVFGK